MTYICGFILLLNISIYAVFGHKFEKYQGFLMIWIIKTIPTKLFCQDA